MLEERSYDLQDSAAAKAFAQMLAILYEYDQGDMGPNSNARLTGVPNHYRTNPYIPGLLPLDSLIHFMDSAQVEILTAWHQQLDTLRQAPRQKMLGLLQGDYGNSPAEYLSVSRALRKYSIPPVETTRTLQQMAQSSNQNVVNGIVNTQALIEGLFQFVLQRAQEEVVMNFMERFLTEDLPQYEEIFPTVVAQFNAPGFSYSHSFIQRVRDAFFEDLQLLSVRLPSILLSDERFSGIQEDPLIYNLLAVYSIIGMAQNELPVEEILPITFRNLYENYAQTEKKLNFQVAETSLDSLEYQAVIERSRTIVDRIKSIYLDLEEGQANIASEMSGILREEELAVPDFADLLLPAYDLDMIMGSDEAAGFRLNLLPSLLAGHLDTAYILGFRSVQAYDKFFAEDFTPEQWKAAGLELARNLNGTWFAEYAIDEFLYAWAADLTTYQLEYDRWKRSLFPEEEMEKAFVQLETNRQNLTQTIEATKDFWMPHLQGNQGLAFDMLGAILSRSYDPNDISVIVEIEATGPETFLETGNQQLRAVEQRFIALNDQIASANPDQQTGNPLQAYLFEKKSPHPFSEVLAKIDLLSEDLNNLRRQLDTLDRKMAPQQVQLMENARPILGMTEALTHLMYCLRSSDPEHKWISKEELDEILSNPDLADAFLGLLYQRMCQVQQVPRLSPEGLAHIVQLTVADLPYLIMPLEADTSDIAAGLSFYYPAAFLVNTLNRVLETPLIVDPMVPDQVRPLAETHPSLNTVPDLSEMVLDLIYYLNARDHRRAMSTAIRLFVLVENFEVDDSVHDFLQEYGFFIADMVDAETGDEVQSLLNGIADPPGSSRLKRRKPMTVGLNAYLGGTVGQESWQNNALQQSDQFYNVAPTMPIGITMSGLIGNAANPPSFSLFLSFLDLGSMLAYREDSNNFGENKITFKNVFKPSLQVHWNINKSPFYLGAGGQIGPVYRDFAGDERSFRSTRFFLSFGVDVPIKTFFVK
jgi:hypothetical protein